MSERFCVSGALTFTASTIILGLGAVTFAGDFNGDGYMDLAIGAPGDAITFGGPGGAGSISAIHGSANGLTVTGQKWLHQDSDGVWGGCEAGDRFGGALAVGDFDGDGYHDLAVGAPKEALGSLTEAGAVVVLYGESNGGLNGIGSQWWQQGDDALLGVGLDAPETNDRFGWEVAAGDFNGDGYDDLAIGAPGENDTYVNEGNVIVLYGSSGGLVADGETELWKPWTGHPVNDNEKYGDALAVGDFDHDGYDDLAIGSPGHVPSGETEAGGGIEVKYGYSGGLGHVTTWFDQTHLPFAANEEGDRFGAALAAGDFNGDGRDDLAIGAPNEDITYGATTDTDAGGLAILYSNEFGLTETGSVGIDQGQFDFADPYDNFGSVLAAADLNSDGYADLAVGVPHEDSLPLPAYYDMGEVNIIPGSSTGIDIAAAWTITQDLLQNGSADTSDYFGAALASGDFNHDFKADLAIGVPGKNLMGYNLGAVYVVYGIRHGLGTYNAVYDKCSNISGECWGDTEFGSALASIPSPNYLFADGFESSYLGRWSVVVQ